MDYREITAESILNRLKHADDWFRCSYTMNIYRGCEHGCTYCDGRSKRYWPKGGNESFSEVILVKKNAPELLDKELFRIKRKQVICLGGGVNDSYQPSEEQYRLTRRCLDTIRLHGFPVHLMTKSRLILRDLDLLKEINEKSWLSVSISFSTADTRLAKLLEPCVPTPKERFDIIRKLSSEGITAGVTFMPVMPYMYDSEQDIEEMFLKAKEAGASYILDSPLTLRDDQMKYFMDFMERTRLKKYIKRYQKLYANGYTPKTGYIKKINRMMFDMSVKHDMPRSMPEYVPKKDNQTKLEN